MYNRYHGNSGRVERIDDRPPPPPEPMPPLPEPPPFPEPPPPPKEPASPTAGELGKLLGKFLSVQLETEDFLLLAVLYLLYRETEDADFLIMMAGVILF